MPYKFSTYLKYIWYKNVLDFWWYDDLKKKLDILEDNRIKINISDLNRYLYDRRNFELGNTNIFDDTKYDLVNYKNNMQIVEYKKNKYSNCGYDADDEMFKPIDNDFVNIMNELSTKLEKFSMTY